jgi:hypothetical protein
MFVRGKTVTRVNDFAGNPFWFDGVKPSAEFNPQLNAPIGGTASFGPAGYLTALSNSSSDAATQQSDYPSSNPAAGPIQLNPNSHGNGFANTGMARP